MKQFFSAHSKGILKLVLSELLLLLADQVLATSYTWNGSTSSDWNTTTNWTPAGVPGSGDAVSIGLGAFANEPVFGLTAPTSTTIASLTFGTLLSTLFGAPPITLTVNSGYTLMVSGNITQAYTSTGGSTTNIAGAGTINCTGNLIIGDNTAPAVPTSLAIGIANMTNTAVFNVSIQNFNISQNLQLNTTSSSATLTVLTIPFTTSNVNNPTLNLNNGNLSVGKIIQTTNSNYVNTPGFGVTILGVGLTFPSATNLSQILINPLTNTIANSTPTLLLGGAAALSLATQGSLVDFYGMGSGTSTVNYNGSVTPTQTVYTTPTANVDASPQLYQNLIISGGSETVGAASGGTLTVGNNLTTSASTVLFNTYNPPVTVLGSWANSGSITQGIGNITISGAVTNSGTLNLGTGNLSITGNYTNNIGGIYTQSTGTTFFNGAGAQALVDNSTTGTKFINVKFSGGGTATMSAGTNNVNFFVSSSGTLTMLNNSKLVAGTITSGGAAYLTLNSDAGSTATVASITGSSAITGNVNVQRYLSGGAGHRGYRLLSSPVYAGTANSNNVYSINYLQNNTILTGSAGGGFDKTGNPTIYLFREDQIPSNASFTGGNFWGITAINNTPLYNYYVNGGTTVYNLPVGSGYMFFFRGDRSAASIATETVSTYVPVAVDVTASGTLNQGQVVVHDWYTPTSANLGFTGTGTGANFAVRGFNLVGNPYASSITWDQYNTASATTGIYAPGVSTTVYELNPLTYNYDTYQTGTTPTHTNQGSNIIASGQGFFVLVSGNTAQLIFNESAKTASENTGASLFMYARMHQSSLNDADSSQHLRLQLALDSINTDDIYIGFNANASTGYVFNEDAPYKPGTGKVSLSSISSDSTSLAINRLPLPKQSQITIPLSVNATADGLYTLNMTELESIPQLYDIWLMDAYKKDSLDMKHNKTYAFNLYLADASSYGSNRFSLVIRQDPALGVHLLNFTAAKTKGGAQTTWVTENEENYTSFTVERSTDNGVTFNSLSSLNSSAIGTYGFLDKNPMVAVDQYRVKITDLNGTVSYSKTISLNYTNTNASNSNITIYPNPASSVVNFTIDQNTVAAAVSQNLQTLNSTTVQPTGSVNAYSVKIMNISGSVVETGIIPQASGQENVSTLLPGTYVIQVVDNKDKSVVGKGTFVKL